MPNQLPTALFLFTDKHGSRLEGLSQEDNALQNIFQHYNTRLAYTARHDFSPTDFANTFAADGENAVIFHVAGHGNSEGITRDGENGEATILKAAILSEYLVNSTHLQVIFINTCDSFMMQSQLSKINTPLVILSTEKIDDASAADASRVFYNTLLQGNTFEYAFQMLNARYNELENRTTNVYIPIWQNDNAKKLHLNLKDTSENQDTSPRYLNITSHAQTQTVIGRDADVQKIHDLLFEQKQILLMNAIGGIGKTTTALYYARIYQKEYAHIIWINGEQSLQDNLLNSQDLWANLHIAAEIDAMLKSNQREQAFNTLKASIFGLHTPILWLIDNANKAARDECKLIQQTQTDHHFLFTSRDTDTNLPTYHLGYLEPADALTLFYKWATRVPKNDKNDALIAALLLKAHHHTLTIVILAKTFEDKIAASLSDFCHKYTQALLNLDEYTPIDLDNHTPDSLGHQILVKVFDTSAIHTNADALHLLTHLSVMPSQDLSFTILQKLLINNNFTIKNLTNAVKNLKQTGWIEQADAQNAIYACHPLIQEIIRHTKKVDFEKVEALFHTIQTILRNNNKNEWWKNDIYLPYSIALAENIQEENQAIGNLYNEIGYTINAQGDYDTALDYYKKDLAINEKVLGTEHPYTATSYNNIAGIYESKGDYNTAFDYHKKALAIREKVLGTAHPSTATTYNNIAGIYESKGDYDTALDYHKKALAIKEKVLGTAHPSTATSYNNIGLIYKAQGDYDTALDYYKKDLAIREKILGTTHPSTATTYNNMAGIYESKGDYNTALDYYKKALAIKEKVLGTAHPSTATTYNNIASIYKAQGDYDTALDYHKKALAICEKVLGTEHPDTATTYNNIAGIYKVQGDYNTALDYYKKDLAICEKVLGTTHPDTATTYNNIASIYQVQGNYDTALNYYKKALTIREKVLGTAHPDTAITYNNIASIYKTQGDYDTALDYYKKAVIIFKKVLTLQHPNTKIIFNNYKICLNEAKESLAPAIIQAHAAFIQAEFSEYLD
jgi:tetratricopeptide (TPR) repeat protein